MAKITLEQFAQKLDQQHSQVCRRVALGLYGRLLHKTPVDTGWARMHWMITINNPSVDSPGSAPAGTQPGTYPPPNLPRLAAQRVPYIWITNNVPYIEALNHGHSQQAPQNFVELAVLEEVAEARRGGVNASTNIQG